MVASLDRLKIIKDFFELCHTFLLNIFSMCLFVVMVSLETVYRINSHLNKKKKKPFKFKALSMIV